MEKVNVSQGTALIMLAISEGVVMAADDLVYRLDAGTPVPAETNVRKVFAMGNILIGTAGVLRCKQSAPISAEREAPQTVSIEYKFEDWIVEFIRARRNTSDNDPETVANALDAKMRETFKPVEILLEHGTWGDQSPGDRLASYVVAGYSKNFKNFHLFELGAEYNLEGNGVRYLTPIRHGTKLPKDLFFGEDQFFLRALEGVEPQAGTLRREMPRCLSSAAVVLPNIPEALQKLTASAVSLVRVEAEFNPNKVGRTVNAVIIDRAARKPYLAAF